MSSSEIDTGTNELLGTLDAGILTLTLNRPEARNAMSRAMSLALQQQSAAADVDPAVKCIVLTGAGKDLCAGGDVKAMAASGGVRVEPCCAGMAGTHDNSRTVQA